MDAPAPPPEQVSASAGEKPEPKIWSPTASLRHREDVHITEAPMAASYVEVEVAARPTGGKRRSEDVPVEQRAVDALAEPVEGKRASRDEPEALLVNAADAADYLAARQTFWTSTQILSHPEIARLAVEEVRKALVEEQREAKQTSGGLFGRKARKQALADIERQVQDLWSVAELLAEAHRHGLVRGD